jgi:transcriptional regulator with XRE-family HTH domain
MGMSLGEKLKKHRKQKGYSLDRLAEVADTSKSYLWELENRETRKPSGEKLTLIAQALDVTTDYLLNENATPDDDVIKDAFFRRFRKLDPDEQKKIQDIVDAWGKK